jgi:protein-tyrosine phosphatase
MMEGNFTSFELESNTDKLKVIVGASPTNITLNQFNKFIIENKVTDVFCFNEIAYDSQKIVDNINFHYMVFSDGSYPSNDLIKKFDKLLDKILKKPNPCLIFHCVAGLGRAPIMLAYIMVSRYKYSPEDAIGIIRYRRKGSINSKQLSWLINLHNSNCVIM